MKNFLLALLFITAVSNAQVTNGLIAHYSFNGNTNDQSANGNNGTNYGATLATGRFGQPNTAYSFDGNDYVFIPNSTSLNPTNAITISAWYKSVDFSGNGYSSIIDKGYTSHVLPTYQYKLGVTGNLYGGSAYGRFGFSVTTSNNVVTSVFTSNNYWVADTWYFIVGVYDGSQIKLYIDNQLITSQTLTGSLANYSTDVNIGNNTTLSDFLEGTLDDLRIFDRALSDSEISELYNATMPVSSFSTSTNTTTICAGTSVNFYDQSSGNPVSWNWNITPTVGLSSSSFTSASPVVTFSTTGIYTVNLQANGANEEGTIFTQTINVINASVSVTDSVQSVCYGKAITFHANGASTYTWSNGGGTGAIGNYTALTSGVYTVTGFSAGCIATTTVNLITLPLPQLTLSDSKLICKGEQIVLTVSGAASYLWMNASTNSSISVSPTITSVYLVTGIGANGCISSSAITISVSSCTDLQKLSKTASYLVFPNPTSGKIILTGIDNVSKINNIEVMDALGNIVLKKSILLADEQSEVELDLQSFASGVYFIKIQTNQSEIRPIRVIKQ